MKIEHDIEVDCRPAVLWNYLDDPEKMKLWLKGLVEVDRDGPRGVGSTATLRIKEGERIAEYQSRVIQREPPTHLTVDLTGRSLGDRAMLVEYLLTDLGGTTRLDYLCTCEFGPGGWFISLLAGLFGKAQVKGFLKTLKRLAEAEAGTA